MKRFCTGRLTAHLIALLFVISCFGCGDKKPTAKDIMARTDMSDTEAIEALARLEFFDPPKLSVTEEADGIVVDVTMHNEKDAEIKTLAGVSPEQFSASADLMMSVLAGRDLVEHGRSRNLKRLVINIRQTAIGSSGQAEDIDVFGYSLSKDRFDAFLNTGSAADIAKGGARRTIEATCEVLYDQFSGITFQATDK